MTRQHRGSYLIPAPEWLNSSPGRSLLPEILWNFSHFKGQQRLTLSQNPHFYMYLPTSPAAYAAAFESSPTEHYEGRIYVLTNSSGRVFFEFDGKSRAFDIIRAMNNTLVFKGLVPYVSLFPP